MAKLSIKQKKLLSSFGYCEKDVLDASGMNAKSWKLKLSELGKKIAIGVTPCKNSGHSIRNKSGNCVECNPVILKYMSNYKNDGDVYVAWSKKGKIAKIGCAKDAVSRIKSLVATCYGGQNDWAVKLIYECTNSGLVENMTHKHLGAYKLPGVTYFHNGKEQKCSELFKCSITQAKSALQKSVSDYVASY